MNSFKLAVIILFLSVPIFVHSQVKVNVNIGTAPVWGPPITNEDYYYLPDIETYYDLRTSQYIYMNNGRWVRVNNLPRRYQNYNLNRAQVVVLNDYRGQSPFVNYKNHKVKYKKNNGNWKSENGNSGNGKNKNKNKD